MNLRFSGHETFVARTFWPKKGYDFVEAGGKFNDETAVVELGIGKNMVASIQFWLKALGLTHVETNKPTEFAKNILGKNGLDPFLEDIATVWLMHYSLIKTNYSSIYYLIFNELRKEKAVFNKSQLASFIKRKYSENDNDTYNYRTIEKDISVFGRLYKRLNYTSISKNFEDEINSLMLELELISSTIEDEIIEGTKKIEKVEWFHLHGEKRTSLPPEIILYSILDNFPGANNIAFRRLQTDINSPGLIFLLSKDALYHKLKKLESLVPGILLSETAGNSVLVIPEGLNKWDILRKYYAN